MDPYIFHDANACNDQKIMMLFERMGVKGYGIYWMTIEFLRLQREYKADVALMPALARKMNITVATLQKVILESGLFEVEDTTFSSHGLTLRMASLDAKREAIRASGRLGGLAKHQKIRENMLSDAKAINKPNKLNKETNPSISPQGETRKGGAEIFIDPPEYALNKLTHNYEGLKEELRRLKVTEAKEHNAIMRLTDFGKLKGKIWKIVYDINNSPQQKAKIMMPGKYILKLLQV